MHLLRDPDRKSHCGKVTFPILQSIFVYYLKTLHPRGRDNQISWNVIRENQSCMWVSQCLLDPYLIIPTESFRAGTDSWGETSLEMDHKHQKTGNLPLADGNLKALRDSRFVSCGRFKSVPLGALGVVRCKGSWEVSCWWRNAPTLQLTGEQSWWFTFLCKVWQCQVSKLNLLLFICWLIANGNSVM